ncbi:hypothetical protein V8D89_009024 [Ganoderma adspersum]
MSAHTTRKRAWTESEESVLKQELDTKENTATGTHHGTPPGPDLLSQAQPNHECECNGTAPVLEWDPEFWFSNGMVILVAKNVEFRFYRALLTDRSPIFNLKAKFADKHPTRPLHIDDQTSFPCPIVHLMDSPEDLRHILWAYVSGKQTSFLGEAEPSFYQISAYIRFKLGLKYQLNELYEQSHQFLKSHYTDNLETWTKHTYWQPLYWQGNESIGVVNLARLMNDAHILPTSLMSCVYMDEHIVQGFRREDGTLETLMVDDLGRCFRASRVLWQINLAEILHVLQDTVSPGCIKEKGCTGMLQGALRRLKVQMEQIMTCSPFKLTPEYFLLKGYLLRMCMECTKMVEEHIRKEHMELWAQLPDVLDIKVPGWGNGAPQDDGAT